jgi:hypothetical protein
VAIKQQGLASISPAERSIVLRSIGAKFSEGCPMLWLVMRAASPIRFRLEIADAWGLKRKRDATR